MTCTHIKDARILLTKLNGKLRDASDMTVHEDIGPYAIVSSIKAHLDAGFFTNKYWATSDKIKPRVISRVAVEEKINEIENKLSECNCYANESAKRVGDDARRNDLISNHREERRNLQAQLDDIKKDYKDTTDRQYALIETERKENALVRTENSKLQKALGLSEAQAKQLEIRLTEKTNDLKLREQALDRLRQAFLDLSISNATNATRVQVIGEQLDWTKGRLEINDNRIALMENKIDQKQQQLETLRQSFANLQIKYETETKDKDNRLEQKNKEIKLLKNQAGQSQEKLSNEREHWKEGSLEELAVQLGINLQQIDNLRRYYERLVDARKNYNQVNITTHESNITRIKQELINGGVSVANTQKIGRKCEKLAELRIELEEVRQEQYQARQEQSTNY